MIYANILTLVIVVKILVSLNFTFLGIYIVSYFIFHQKKKKEAEEVGLNTVLGSVHLILQALGSH